LASTDQETGPVLSILIPAYNYVDGVCRIVMPLLVEGRSDIDILVHDDSTDLRNQLNCSNIGYIPYGIDTHPSDKIIQVKQRTEGMIIFSGNMHHPPNVDGAMFFLQQILPLVLKTYPNAKLWIVGASPDEKIREEARAFGDHVIIPGKVADLSEYIRQAMVSVCPVNLKIGVQTKILEALAWGTPVVTTSAGNSGICGSSGQDLWVEDNPKIFAERVVSLLKVENWEKISGSGRDLAYRKFSWPRSAAILEHLLEKIRIVT
jgi:glycosyltransferase involved in cell wall biosynthesis